MTPLPGGGVGALHTQNWLGSGRSALPATWQPGFCWLRNSRAPASDGSGAAGARSPGQVELGMNTEISIFL